MMMEIPRNDRDEGQRNMAPGPPARTSSGTKRTEIPRHTTTTWDLGMKDFLTQDIGTGGETQNVCKLRSTI
jgi:hypothetical protein